MNLFSASPIRKNLELNKLEDSLPACRQFEVLHSKDNDNYLACAWVYYRLDKIDSAEKFLEIAKSSFSLPEYQLLLGYGKLKRKLFDEAKKLFSSVSNEHRGTRIGTSAQELYAEMYDVMGQLDTAAFIYKQVVDEDPKRARAHWGLGRYYLGKGDTRRAATHLQRTAELWPTHLGSRYNLGVLNISIENYPDAAKWLTESYKINKSDAGVLEQLGILFEKRGNLREALKWWQRALDLKPDSPIAKEKIENNLGEVIEQLVEKGKMREAFAKINQRPEMVSRQPKLLLKRAVVYRSLGEYGKASTDLLSYLETNPNDATALRELGIVYVNIKVPEKALTYFMRSLEVKEDGMTYAWLGLVYELKEDLLKSRDSWKKAIDLLKDPKELEKASRRLKIVEKKLQEKIK